MSRFHIQAKPKSWVWGTLTSIRLTVSLLFILAGVAVIGTVLPQNQPVGRYLTHYGEVWGELLWRGGFTNVYRSPWFLAVISLLGLNILACVVHRLPEAARRTARPLTWEAALALPERGRVTWPEEVDPHPLIAVALSRELGRYRHQTASEQEIYFTEHGRFRPLGPYIIHLALLLILAGGLVGKFGGVEGRLPVTQGTMAGSFLEEGRGEQPLHFQVRLDQFQVAYYEPGGAPKEFRSDLTFLQDGREVYRATCRVNEPVTFRGFTFYQSSYGAESTGPVRLTLQWGKQRQTIEMPLRQMVELPGGHGKVMALRVDGNFQGYGPAVLIALSRGSGHPAVFWVWRDYPESVEPPGPLRITADSIPLTFYSVFQVKRDPGVWWVYAGFLLFLPGFYLAFFRPAQRWALVLEKTPEGEWQGRLLGASPRQREEFTARQERLLLELKRGTPS